MCIFIYKCTCAHMFNKYDDSILDMSDDEIIVKDTPQDSISPMTFSKKIVNHLGIKSQKRGTETVNTLSKTQSDTCCALFRISHCSDSNKLLTATTSVKWQIHYSYI